MLVRQGHPGPGVPAYRSYEHKFRDAQRHRQADAIPWTVLSDDLEGSVHRHYGMLADPTYLIDAEGRVAFYGAVTHAPTLHRALDQLSAQENKGIVAGGYDRRPHVLQVIVGGWPALRRGLPQSVVDLETAVPTTGVMPFVGHQLRGALAPVALRATPLPVAARFALGVAVGVLVAAALAPGRRTGQVAGEGDRESMGADAI